MFGAKTVAITAYEALWERDIPMTQTTRSDAKLRIPYDTGGIVGYLRNGFPAASSRGPTEYIIIADNHWYCRERRAK